MNDVRGSVSAALLLFGSCAPAPSEGPRPTAAAAVAGPLPSASVAAPARAAAVEIAPPERTYALVVGVLGWKDPRLTSFETRGRKDEELHRRLSARRGADARRHRLLLDAEATRSATLGALGEVVAAARRDAGAEPPTLVFYYAGHGIKEDDGTIHLAPYDVVSADAARSGISMSDLEAALSEAPPGARILLMADCCFSGALAGVAEKLAAKGFAATSLTSADASNTSTQNWTFTQTVLDGLAGDSLADRDGDGAISVGELASEIEDAMKFRERQRAGAFGAEDGVTFAGALPGPRHGEGAGAFALGGYAAFAKEGKLETVRVRAARGDKLAVRFFRYADVEDADVRPEDLGPIWFGKFPEGASLSVEWGGRVWPAKVVRVEGDFHLVTYPGWPAVWDEWILSDRVVAVRAEKKPLPSARRADPASFAKGAKVSVEWNGRWWPAVVLEVEDARFFVHYEGYDASWDEWVGATRIQPR